MSRSWLPALAFVLGLGMFVAALGRSPHATGPNLLANGDFEAWTGSKPDSWFLPSAISPSSNAHSGTAVHASAAVTIFQTVDAQPAATYFATAWVSGASGGQANLGLRFEGGGAEIGGAESPGVSLGGSYVQASMTMVAPAGTTRVKFSIRLSSASGQPVDAYVDDASLTMSEPPPPTPTTEPTSTPTPVPTSTAESTSTAAPTATSAGGSGATPTATSKPGDTPTRTPTSTRTPASTRTPTPVPTATSPHTPTPPKAATSTRVPTLAPTPTPGKAATAPSSSTPRPAGAGGLLQNGGFEFEADGKPEAWSKYGGVMAITTDAYEGDRAATLESDTASTKWLYQAVPVVEGHRYVASAMGRIAGGDGEVFLRLSWYASDDGSGTTIDQFDSAATGSRLWTSLDASSDASPGSRSVRVRLMLRPAGPATAAFDAASLIDLGQLPPQTVTTDPEASATATRPSVASGPVALAAAPGRPDSRSPALAAASTGLRLSEVLSDPEEAGRDSPFEWVELVNAGPDPVDLGGWKLGDAQEMDVLPALLVPPGGYVVVAGKSVLAIPGATIVRVADGEIGAGLNNNGEVVRLLAPDGTEVDALSFGDNTSVFDPPPPAPPASRTLGARAPGADPSGENWALTDKPSPGGPNTFPSPAPRAPGEITARGGAPDLPDPDTGDGDKGPSALPWVILGVASGAGLMGLGLAGKRAWPDIRQRTKRGG